MSGFSDARATMPWSDAKRRALTVGAIALATLAAYFNSLHGALVLDDQSNVLDNPSIRHLWPPAWLAAPVEAGAAGRPVANFTYAVNYATSGTAAWSYHALNVALHALSALVLCGVVRRTLLGPTLRARFGAASTPLALAAAVLWLVHPLATAAVDYVSQRTELLAALCQLLTLYAFVRATGRHPLDDNRPSRGCWLAMAIGACTLGMASKETTVVLPVLVLLYDRTFVAGTFLNAWRARRTFYCGLAATWLVLAALIATSRLPERGVGFGLGVAWFDYAFTACGAQLRYLGLAGWPSPLVFDYGWELSPSFGAAVALTTAFAVVARAFWRGREWSFAGAWFFVLLAPTSTVVPVVQQPIAESRVYLALAGIVALAVIALHAVLGRRLWPAVAALALVGSSLTIGRNLAYSDELTLWTDTLAKCPQNARAHSNLARALLQTGQSDAALRHALDAIQLSPRYLDAHSNAGEALVRLGRAAEAVPHFELVLAGRPRSAAAHYNLATALVHIGRVDEAIARFDAALALDPALQRAHNNLCVALLQAGRVAEAVTHGAEAARLAPQSADAHYNLGNALAQAGRLAESIEHLATAVRLQPSFVKARNNLGAVLLRAGRRDEAIATFEAALRINPNNAELLRNLAAARRTSP